MNQLKLLIIFFSDFADIMWCLSNFWLPFRLTKTVQYRLSNFFLIIFSTDLERDFGCRKERGRLLGSGPSAGYDIHVACTCADIITS